MLKIHLLHHHAQSFTHWEASLFEDPLHIASNMTTELAMWFHISLSCLNKNEKDTQRERGGEVRSFGGVVPMQAWGGPHAGLLGHHLLKINANCAVLKSIIGTS